MDQAQSRGQSRQQASSDGRIENKGNNQKFNICKTDAEMFGQKQF